MPLRTYSPTSPDVLSRTVNSPDAASYCTSSSPWMPWVNWYDANGVYRSSPGNRRSRMNVLPRFALTPSSRSRVAGPGCSGTSFDS